MRRGFSIALTIFFLIFFLLSTVILFLDFFEKLIFFQWVWISIDISVCEIHNILFYSINQFHFILRTSVNRSPDLIAVNLGFPYTQFSMELYLILKILNNSDCKWYWPLVSKLGLWAFTPAFMSSLKFETCSAVCLHAGS